MMDAEADDEFNTPCLSTTLPAADVFGLTTSEQAEEVCLSELVAAATRLKTVLSNSTEKVVRLRPVLCGLMDDLRVLASARKTDPLSCTPRLALTSRAGADVDGGGRTAALLLLLPPSLSTLGGGEMAPAPAGFLHADSVGTMSGAVTPMFSTSPKSISLVLQGGSLGPWAAGGAHFPPAPGALLSSSSRLGQTGGRESPPVTFVAAAQDGAGVAEGSGGARSPTLLPRIFSATSAENLSSNDEGGARAGSVLALLPTSPTSPSPPRRTVSPPVDQRLLSPSLPPVPVPAAPANSKLRPTTGGGSVSSTAVSSSASFCFSPPPVDGEQQARAPQPPSQPPPQAAASPSSVVATPAVAASGVVQSPLSVCSIPIPERDVSPAAADRGAPPPLPAYAAGPPHLPARLHSPRLANGQAERSPSAAIPRGASPTAVHTPFLASANAVGRLSSFRVADEPGRMSSASSAAMGGLSPLYLSRSRGGTPSLSPTGSPRGVPWVPAAHGFTAPSGLLSPQPIGSAGGSRFTRMRRRSVTVAPGAFAVTIADHARELMREGLMQLPDAEAASACAIPPALRAAETEDAGPRVGDAAPPRAPMSTTKAAARAKVSWLLQDVNEDGAVQSEGSRFASYARDSDPHAPMVAVGDAVCLCLPCWEVGRPALRETLALLLGPLAADALDASGGHSDDPPPPTQTIAAAAVGAAGAAGTGAGAGAGAGASAVAQPSPTAPLPQLPPPPRPPARDYLASPKKTNPTTEDSPRRTVSTAPSLSSAVSLPALRRPSTRVGRLHERVTLPPLTQTTGIGAASTAAGRNFPDSPPRNGGWGATSGSDAAALTPSQSRSLALRQAVVSSTFFVVTHVERMYDRRASEESQALLSPTDLSTAFPASGSGVEERSGRAGSARQLPPPPMPTVAFPHSPSSSPLTTTVQELKEAFRAQVRSELGVEVASWQVIPFSGRDSLLTRDVLACAITAATAAQGIQESQPLACHSTDCSMEGDALSFTFSSAGVALRNSHGEAVTGAEDARALTETSVLLETSNNSLDDSSCSALVAATSPPPQQLTTPPPSSLVAPTLEGRAALAPLRPSGKSTAPVPTSSLLSPLSEGMMAGPVAKSPASAASFLTQAVSRYAAVVPGAPSLSPSRTTLPGDSIGLPGRTPDVDRTGCAVDGNSNDGGENVDDISQASASGVAMTATQTQEIVEHALNETWPRCGAAQLLSALDGFERTAYNYLLAEASLSLMMWSAQLIQSLPAVVKSARRRRTRLQDRLSTLTHRAASLKIEYSRLTSTASPRAAATQTMHRMQSAFATVAESFLRDLRVMVVLQEEPREIDVHANRDVATAHERLRRCIDHVRQAYIHEEWELRYAQVSAQLMDAAQAHKQKVDAYLMEHPDLQRALAEEDTPEGPGEHSGAADATQAASQGPARKLRSTVSHDADPAYKALARGLLRQRSDLERQLLMHVSQLNTELINFFTAVCVSQIPFVTSEARREVDAFARACGSFLSLLQHVLDASASPNVNSASASSVSTPAAGRRHRATSAALSRAVADVTSLDLLTLAPLDRLQPFITYFRASLCEDQVRALAHLRHLRENTAPHGPPPRPCADQPAGTPPGQDLPSGDATGATADTDSERNDTSCSIDRSLSSVFAGRPVTRALADGQSEQLPSAPTYELAGRTARLLRRWQLQSATGSPSPSTPNELPPSLAGPMRSSRPFTSSRSATASSATPSPPQSSVSGVERCDARGFFAVEDDAAGVPEFPFLPPSPGEGSGTGADDRDACTDRWPLSPLQLLPAALLTFGGERPHQLRRKETARYGDDGTASTSPHSAATADTEAEERAVQETAEQRTHRRRLERVRRWRIADTPAELRPRWLSEQPVLWVLLGVWEEALLSMCATPWLHYRHQLYATTLNRIGYELSGTLDALLANLSGRAAETERLLAEATEELVRLSGETAVPPSESPAPAQAPLHVGAGETEGPGGRKDATPEDADGRSPSPRCSRGCGDVAVQTVLEDVFKSTSTVSARLSKLRAESFSSSARESRGAPE